MNSKMKKHVQKLFDEQSKFIFQEYIVLCLFSLYKNNPDDFPVLLGADIQKKYMFEESWGKPEFVLESIAELACDIVHEPHKFKTVGNGIFVALHLSDKKNKNFLKDFNEYFIKKAFKTDWGI